MVALMVVSVLAVGLLCYPQTARAQEPIPVSVTLSGWGWCVAYREISGVVADLAGYRIPRENATDVEDIYLEGTLTFNTSDITDSFDLELRGTKTRSLFFLKQVSVGEDPMIIDMMAEFEGTWLGETDYVACEGRIALSAPNHIAKPYLFVLRTKGVEVPVREPGGWVGNMEFAIQKLTGAFDEIANRLSDGGSLIKEAAGDFLMQTAVIAREVRSLGVPYFI
jgi:hypothetical protein